MHKKEVSPDAEETERAWKMILDLRASENHFNEIKAQVRTLVSTWLLAAFGAMGFLLTQKLSIELPVEVAILAVAFAASLGLLLLWVLDMLVYHRLLDASFTEVRKLEEKYPQLPQVHRNMVASQPGGQATNFQAFFYIGAITAPLLFGGGLFVHWCLRFGVWVATAVAITIFVVMLVLGRLIRLKSPNPAFQDKVAVK